MNATSDAVVVGAAGPLGARLVRSLLLQGLQVRAVDRRPVGTWPEVHPRADNRCADLAAPLDAVAVVSGATTVYDVSAVGPVGADTDRMCGVLADTNLLVAARDQGVDRIVIASSAEVLPADDDRCWRQRFTERLAGQLAADGDVDVRTVRLAPVFGDDADPATVVGLVVRTVAAALAAGRWTLDLPHHADDPVSAVYVDDAALGLQLVAHGTTSVGPHHVVAPSPVRVDEVVRCVLDTVGVDLTVRYGGVGPTPVVEGDAAALRASLDWVPDIPLAAAVAQVWSAADTGARRRPTPCPSVRERRAHRWGAAPAASPSSSPRVAGRHRYENAG